MLLLIHYFFLNSNFAFFLSNNVFPKNVPNPSPEFELNSFDFDLI